MSKSAIFFLAMTIASFCAAITQGLDLFTITGVRAPEVGLIILSSFAGGCFFVLWIRSWRNSGKDENELDEAK